MSIYPNVTQEDLKNSGELREQQKNQRPIKIINKTLKQTHDEKLAESLSPITKKLTEMNDSIKKFQEKIKKKLKNQNLKTKHLII